MNHAAEAQRVPDDAPRVNKAVLDDMFSEMIRNEICDLIRAGEVEIMFGDPLPVNATLPDDVLSVNTGKAAEILGISRSQLYNLIRTGEIASSKVPSSSGRSNLHLIEIAELRAFLHRYRITPGMGLPAA